MCIRDRRSSGWFGTAPRREVPEGLPPSPVQHRVQKLYLHQAPSSCGTHEPVGMLTWETTVEAQALYARGWTKSAIARHLGINRRTVREYLKGQQVPGRRADRPPAGGGNPVGLAGVAGSAGGVGVGLVNTNAGSETRREWRSCGLRCCMGDGGLLALQSRLAEEGSKTTARGVG